MAKTQSIKFLVPKGTRELYEAAATKAGLSARNWMRQTLRDALEEQLEGADDVEVPSRRKLPVHPRLRRRLQPKIRIREELRTSPDES